ncbi:MAG: putative quinol monooxygenase [Acidimicrobiia bacterium]
MTAIVKVIATFVPEPSRVSDFVDLLKSMVQSSRAEPGCLRYDFYEDGEGRFFMLEDYQDQAAVKAHRESDHYKEYRSKVAEMLAAPITVTVLSPLDVRID